MKSEILSGEFEEIRIDEIELPPRPIYMATYHDHRKSDIIKKFGQLMVENLNKEQFHTRVT